MLFSDQHTHKPSGHSYLIAKPVGQRVHTKGRLLNEKDTKDPSIDKTAEPVAPAKTADKHREDEAHEDDDGKVVFVLPHHYRILIQVGYVLEAYGSQHISHPKNIAGHVLRCQVYLRYKEGLKSRDAPLTVRPIRFGSTRVSLNKLIGIIRLTLLHEHPAEMAI